MKLWALPRAADSQRRIYCLVDYAGTDQSAGSGVDASTDLLLAGLEWGHDADARPGRLAADQLADRLAAARPAVLEWRGSRSTLRVDAIHAASHRDGGFPTATGSLLAQMCLAVEQEKRQGGHDDIELEGLWVFVARVRAIDDEDTVRWWIGGTEGGQPSHTVPEEIVDSLRDLVRTLGNIAATSPHLAGIAVVPSSADRLIDAIEEAAPQIQLPVTVTPLAIGGSSGGPDGEGPRFEEPPRHKAVTIAAGMVGCVMLAGGMAWYGGLFSQPSLPEPEITFTVPVAGAVQSACLDGMNSAWPRTAGWRVSATGCARTGHLPNDIRVQAAGAGKEQWFESSSSSAAIAPDVVSDDSTVIAWRVYERNRDANAVLATAAGDKLIATHLQGRGASHGHAITGNDGNRILVWRRLPLRTRQASPGGFVPIAQIEGRLAQAFVDVPGSVRAERNSVTVTIGDPPEHALQRVDAAGSHVDLLAVERRDNRTVLRLRPGNDASGNEEAI